jgi:hypothetical protein
MKLSGPTSGPIINPAVNSIDNLTSRQANIPEQAIVEFVHVECRVFPVPVFLDFDQDRFDTVQNVDR